MPLLVTHKQSPKQFMAHPGRHPTHAIGQGPTSHPHKLPDQRTKPHIQNDIMTRKICLERSYKTSLPSHNKNTD
eukprot:2479861-Amphidinium_carterae.1